MNIIGRFLGWLFKPNPSDWLLVIAGGAGLLLYIIAALITGPSQLFRNSRIPVNGYREFHPLINSYTIIMLIPFSGGLLKILLSKKLFRKESNQAESKGQ